MKIVLLILHIICAVLMGIGAIIAPHILPRILYTLTCSLWSVCAGMSITRLIFDI